MNDALPHPSCYDAAKNLEFDMRNWKTVVFVLLGNVAVVLIALCGATSGGSRPYDPNLMASWMQAIGSIGAILASVAVFQWQNRLNKRAEEVAATGRFQNVLRAASVVGDELCQLLSIISNSLRDTGSAPATFLGVTAMLADATVAVQGLPLAEFDEATSDQIATIRRVCREVSMLASASAIVQRTPSEIENLKRLIDRWYDYVSKARDELTDYRKRL